VSSIRRLCKVKGEFVKKPDGSDGCIRCGGFGLIKKERELRKRKEEEER